MGRILFVLLLFYFHVNPSLSTSPSSSLNSAHLCLQRASSALLQLKSTLYIDTRYTPYPSCATSYPKTNSWNETTDCCLWEGVTCDNVTSHVIALDLSCSFLIGSLSANSSFFLLQRLQQLNLAYNNLNGSIPSAFFSQLVSLTHLNLSANDFSGLIPSEISLLSKLVSLDLSGNHFTIDKYCYDMLARNLSKLTNLVFDGVNMSCVPPSSLLNFTSSLKRLSLVSCELCGKLPTEVFRFPYLQHLHLSYNIDLTGHLPKSNWSSPLELLDISYCNFGGPLPASLGNLTEIVSLDLLPNSFEGEIPDVFGSLKKLDGLDLSSSNFSGPLPSTIFNLTQVTHLDLSNNSLEGELPAHVGGVQNLEYLFLGKNLISGSVPSWLFALPSLNVLDLSHNKLLTLPTDDQIQKPNSVQKIYLGSNEMHGSIPSFFFDLVNLTDLDLSSNNLSGVITSEMLAKFKSLGQLDLSNNSLLSLSSSHSDVNYTFHELYRLSLSSCNIRRFPSFLKTAKNLIELDLSNNKIDGSISKWESEGWVQLTHLNLSYNSLTSLEQYPGENLESFDASSNHLHGPLLAPPTSLRELLISNNNLTGEIPTLIYNLSSLEQLDLSMNKLGGIIPACLGNSSSLSKIYLQMNNFHGQIPTFVSDMLISLALNDNQLQGLLPQSLASCSGLRFLNVANNKLNDTFPHWLGPLPDLQVVVLRSNRFHGPLDRNGNCSCTTAPSCFSSLEIIDLSQNEFTGTLPTKFLQDLMVMKCGNTSTKHQQRICPAGKPYSACISDGNRGTADSDDSVKVVIKRLQRELKVVGGTSLPGFTIIDFSNNQFHGPIPEVLGELGSLLLLNLSCNQLNGSIPPALGDMKALESLDLSSNKLEGIIPPELTDLTFLGVLNLSQNSLVGPIPQEKQFSTFEKDSYSGNPGLWGCPLSKKCRRIPEPPPSSIVDQDDDDDDDDDSRIAFIWKVAGMGYGCGVVLGLSMGYIIFTTGRPWWIVRKIERDWQRNVTNWIWKFRRRRN